MILTDRVLLWIVGISVLNTALELRGVNAVYVNISVMYERIDLHAVITTVRLQIDDISAVLDLFETTSSSGVSGDTVEVQVVEER